MKQQDPVDKMLDEAAKALQFIMDHKDDDQPEGEVDPEITAMLADLHQKVALFKESTALAMEFEEVDSTDIQRTINSPSEQLDVKVKQQLERAGRMKKDAIALWRSADRQVHKKKETRRKNGIFGSGDKTKKRRKPLDRGFKKGWKKL